MKRPSNSRPRPAKSFVHRKRIAWMVLSLGLMVAGAFAGYWISTRDGAEEPEYEPRPRGSVTFNKDIAPILHQHCASCHRPGEAGPFDLITYADARKRAAQLVEVTRSRFMPPWLPEAGHEPLLGERRLSTTELGLIEQWTAEGAHEGRATELRPLPKWTEGWQLGPPDLVLTMPEAYVLPPEGVDVYRNFVLHLPTTSPHHVRAVEFRPSSKAVHHAFIRIDRTSESRERDAQDPGPGFGGMSAPGSAETPSGHFLGWQPGRGPAQAPEGLAWTLPAGADVVLLMHLQPSGRAESIQPSLGLYFTDRAPTNRPAKFGLVVHTLDIPAGDSNYVVEKTVQLPVAVDLLALLPHAHYLGKRLEGFAVLPDGTRKTLLLIPEWDFNWQSDYRFARPVFLPRGTTLGMRYTYDNSTSNARNPFQPPARVKYGLQTTNEMAELHFQMLAHHAAEREVLAEATHAWTRREIIEANQQRLREDPTDAESLIEIAKMMLVDRNIATAEELLQRAVALRPDLPDARYSMGVLLMETARLAEAEREFVEAIRLAPGHFKARNNAGLCCLRLGRLEEAAAHFQSVLQLRPEDSIAKDNLELVWRVMRGEIPRK